MKDVLWLLAMLALPLFGAVVFRLRLVRELDAPARWSLAFAAGAVVLASIMFGMSVAGVHWTRTTILVALAIVLLAARPSFRGDAPPITSRPLALTLLAIVGVLTLYGILDARETCGDLIYFWGPKGQQFYLAEKIDTGFLAWPHYSLMHPDYPPLIPEIYAWGSTVAHGFSWWGALLLTPAYLLATTFSFRGLVRQRLGDERAAAYASLLAALLAFGFARGMVAGAGEPPLILFEIIALTALTFHGESRGGIALAAIALTGVAATKVEGAAFAAIALFAFGITRRRLAPAITAALPAAAFLSAWILFARHFQLIDQYGRAGGKLNLEGLGPVLHFTAIQASYGVWWAPWFAVLAPMAITRRWKPAALPLLVAGGLIASTIYFYLHAADLTGWLLWIRTSAERVLLAPLACLLVASAASSE